MMVNSYKGRYLVAKHNKVDLYVLTWKPVFERTKTNFKAGCTVHYILVKE